MIKTKRWLMVGVAAKGSLAETVKVMDAPRSTGSGEATTTMTGGSMSFCSCSGTERFPTMSVAVTQ